MKKSGSKTSFKKKRIEDQGFIKNVNSFLKKKRDFIIKMPKPGTPVILMVSGGADSTVAWLQLLEIYKLKVFPVHILTGQPRNEFEQKSVEEYSKIFAEKYPDLCQQPLYISQHTTPPEIRQYYRGDLSKWVHPSIIAKHSRKNTTDVSLKREFTFPAFLPYQAVTAAQFLYFKAGVKIRTIIINTLPSDAEYNASQSLTANRATMQSICAYTNDYTWQLFSLAYEPELKLFTQKDDFIRWASLHDLDLGKTYSCFRGTPENCGSCLACIVRKRYFKSAGVEDTTEYFTGFTGFSLLKYKLEQIPIEFKKRYSQFFPAERKVKFQDYY